MKALSSIFSDSKINFMKAHKFAFFLSIILVISSLTLVFAKGLNFGIDFSGGVLIEVNIKDVKTQDLREVLKNKIDAQIQNIDGGNFLIRVAKDKNSSKKELKKSEKASNILQNQSRQIEEIKEIFAKNFQEIDYRKIDYVGPQIGSELIKKGFLAFFVSLIALMIYIWARFDWQFGLGGILALIHDAILVIGFYAIFQIEFNLTSIAAILTVVGYSINDSVVIFDRIRENMRKLKKGEIVNILNSSLNSTLTRTILTSMTTLLSLFAIILFGGEVLKSFSLGAAFGIAVGVYSSIYIAAPILIYLDPRSSVEEK